eukprot:scaffold15073_cov110-Skeletonema_dohrnii-CCMP3373.AAC.2
MQSTVSAPVVCPIPRETPLCGLPLLVNEQSGLSFKTAISPLGAQLCPRPPSSGRRRAVLRKQRHEDEVAIPLSSKRLASFCTQ